MILDDLVISFLSFVFRKKENKSVTAGEIALAIFLKLGRYVPRREMLASLTVLHSEGVIMEAEPRRWSLSTSSKLVVLEREQTAALN